MCPVASARIGSRYSMGSARFLWRCESGRHRNSFRHAAVPPESVPEDGQTIFKIRLRRTSSSADGGTRRLPSPPGTLPQLSIRISIVSSAFSASSAYTRPARNRQTDRLFTPSPTRNSSIKFARLPCLSGRHRVPAHADPA